MQLTVEIWPNPETRVERTYDSATLTIGRGRDCDLTIANDIVSSEHARLHVHEGQCRLADLSSTNGTFVNGQRVTANVTLQPGDEIQFGDNGPKIRLLGVADGAQPTEKARAAAPTGRGETDDFRLPVQELPAQESPTATPPAKPPAERPSVDVPSPAPVKPTRRPAPQPIAAPSVAPQPIAPQPVAKQTTKPTVTIRRPVTGRTRAFHLSAFLTTLLVAGIFTASFFVVTAREPSRGYTTLGIVLAIVGSVSFLAVVLYAWRKRSGQEILPGRLRTWLRVHFWLSMGGFWLILLHAGFHIDGGTGTWTLLALLLTPITGIAGWTVYVKLPGQVYSRVGNLARADVERQLERIAAEIEDAAAGGSEALNGFAERVVNGASLSDFAGPAEEATIARSIVELGERRTTMQRQLKQQITLHRYLRGWLWLHIPIALAFVALVFVHIYDATEVKWIVATAGPADFASPESCAQCHQAQYDEWIGSMHAIAQASPVTDLQHRLVLAKEEKDLREGTITKPIVGNLCVRCHAPTGSLGDEDEQEDPLIEIGDRAPASFFGVSCVSCHQIDKLHRGDAESDPDNLAFKNADNLEWTQGRLMTGQIGDGDELPSVGNSEHRGEFRDFFGDPSFCASCHTVAVDDPHTNERVVVLQNTYNEWLDGGQNNINWSQPEVHCLDCHGRNLSRLVTVADRLQRDREPLLERIKTMHDVILKERDVPPAETLAATPADDFDKALPERRRFTHTFVGVDYHLEDDMPYPADHPRAGENPAIQEKAVDNTRKLLSIAAAILITNRTKPRDDELDVDVANLATGHHLPAGFAFAREMWIEVAVSPSRTGDDFRVLIGGERNGQPLKNTTRLNKRQRGLRNFQAALFNEKSRGETVIQNEADTVLKKPEDFEKFNVVSKFQDREQFLLPGEIRKISLRLPTGWDVIDGRPARRVRVRLLFRNYPPEFIEGIAERFENEHNDQPRATRARALIQNLRIHEMAQDTLDL